MKMQRKERIAKFRVIINPLMASDVDEEIIKAEMGANEKSLLRLHFIGWEQVKKNDSQ